MASRLILNVESATPEQVTALYNRVETDVKTALRPDIEIFVAHLVLEASPVDMPAPKVGLDGKPAVALATTPGLAAR